MLCYASCLRASENGATGALKDPHVRDYSAEGHGVASGNDDTGEIVDQNGGVRQPPDGFLPPDESSPLSLCICVQRACPLYYISAERSPKIASFPFSGVAQHDIILCLFNINIKLCKMLYIIIIVYTQHDIIISSLHDLILFVHEIISSRVVERGLYH